MNAKRALIHGTGLIGTSIGLRLREVGWEVVGWDPDPSAVAGAMERGALSDRVSNPDDLADARLMVLAGPLSATVATLRELVPHDGLLVTDVAGVKGPVVAAGGHLGSFVGGHPMAGAATSGPSLASSRLFHGATWILTTDTGTEDDLIALEGIVGSLGANPVRMTAEEHDAAVARVSHLPHMLAASLVALAEADGGLASLAGGGFRDLTRVATSETGWWPEVLATNAGELMAAVTELEGRLHTWKDALAAGNTDVIAALLDAARSARASLGEHHAQVRVVLFDRPGEIARVGHALEASKADVRDFQLRHAEHGGGGILTISVTPPTANVLREALVSEGFTLDD